MAFSVKGVIQMDKIIKPWNFDVVRVHQHVTEVSSTSTSYKGCSFVMNVGFLLFLRLSLLMHVHICEPLLVFLSKG